jgi:hypothetical protein
VTSAPDDDRRLQTALTAAAGGMSLARAADAAGISVERFMQLAAGAGIPALGGDARSLDIDFQTAENFAGQECALRYIEYRTFTRMRQPAAYRQAWSRLSWVVGPHPDSGFFVSPPVGPSWRVATADELRSILADGAWQVNRAMRRHLAEAQRPSAKPHERPEEIGHG